MIPFINTDLIDKIRSNKIKKTGVASSCSYVITCFMVATKLLYLQTSFQIQSLFFYKLQNNFYYTCDKHGEILQESPEVTFTCA